jgi:ABC-type branched-subunit amino acid transport system substrate-binding protein
VIGVPLASGVATAGEVANELGITLITIGAVPSILRENPQYLFQADATSGSDAEPMTTFASELLDQENIKVALAPHDSPSSVEWTEAVSGYWADKVGIEVVANETVPLAAADVTAQAQKIASSNPDVVMMQGVDAGMPVLIGRLRALGFDGPIIGYHGTGSDKNLDQLQDPDVYVQREIRSLDEDASQYPGLDRYIKVIERAGVQDGVDSFVQHTLGTLSFLIMEGALKDCESPCDAAQFNEAITNVSVDTGGLTFGNIEYSPTDHQGVTESVFYHWQDGEVVPALDGKSFHGDVYTMNG